MRRKDREITDSEKIRKIVDSCQCCRLGFEDNGTVYIVPLNFGYIENDGTYTLYFHSAKEGRKIELITRNHCAGFEMDANYQLNEAAVPCGYSARFQSIIGTGNVSFVEDNEEKKQALLAIMQHNTGKDDWEFSEDMFQNVCVFKLVADKLSCKEHL